jgi:hypothetical protein
MNDDIQENEIEDSKEILDAKKLQAKWTDEFTLADKRVRAWHKQADKIKTRYLGEKADNNNSSTMGGDRQINLFYSNISTLESMLYGSIPTVDVSRRYADAADDVGRVAAEVMQRLLNCNIQENEEDYDSILRSVCQDRLLSGLGVARVRYDVETEEDADGVETLVSEDAPLDYYYWADVRWGWCRSFAEMPWLAFCNYMTKKEVKARFGEEKAKNLTYKERTVSTDGNESNDDSDQHSAETKTEVWEVWCKKSKKVYFFNKDAEEMLDTKDDPLQLAKFFPCPPFLIANTTTSLYMPRPDFMLSQELYNDIDVLQTRINKLTSAVKAAGVYDASDDGIKRLMDEGTDNTLIPVSKWAAFSEKGGIAGSVQWMPLQDIVNALDRLVDQRDRNIALLQKVSGMADVMNGNLDNQYEGVGQTKTKEKYGSVRVQALHDSYATFVSKLLRLKAEVISRHFSPETILKMSNMEFSQDVDKVPDAVQLIKNPAQAKLQVAIKPETLAMVDFNRLQEERMSFIEGASSFMQNAAPLIQADKTMLPAALQMMQWALAGFKGAQQIEGVLDRAVDSATKAAEKEAQNPQPSEAEQAQQAAQAANQLQQQLEQLKHGNAMQQIQAKQQAENTTRQQDLQADIATTQAQSQTKIAEIRANMDASLTEIREKARLDVLVETHQAQANIAQTQASGAQEIQKSAIETANKIQENQVKSDLSIKEAQAKEAAKPKLTPQAGKTDGK